MTNVGFIFFICCFLSIFVRCGQAEERVKPDVSSLKAEIKIKRFEKDLFELDTTKMPEGLASLAQKYPLMTDVFGNQILFDQTNPTQTPEQSIANFIKAYPVRALNDTVQRYFPDLKKLESELSLMFRYQQYYLPNKPIPEVVTMISEFGTDVFTAGDSLCGIGLDMFLGENFGGYNQDLFPAFIRRQFHPAYIPIRLAKAIAQNHVGEPTGATLLDFMLLQGKVLYIVDCLLPDMPDSLKMGYTTAQIEGAYANEQAVWARILDQNLLYSTDFNKFKKMVTPSPSAPVIFEEAPGEIGNWVGWQIVKAYAKRNPNASIQDIISQTNGQKFLEMAKYKPR